MVKQSYHTSKIYISNDVIKFTELRTHLFGFFSCIARAKILTEPSIAMNDHPSNDSYSMRVLSDHDVIMKV